MAADAGSIVAKLMMDASQFQSELTKAMSSMDNAKKKGEESGNVLGNIGKGLGTIAGAGFGAYGVAALNATAGVVGLGVALGNMATNAAPLEGLQMQFDNLTQSMGINADAMMAQLKEGSAGMISSMDLMKQFNLAQALVSDEFAKNLPDAMELVSKASAATGQDMNYLMDSLVRGIGRVSPMILDNLGIQVSLTEAYEAYAESIGKSAEELTKQEQQEAVRIATMEKLTEKYGDMEDVSETSAAKLAQFQATMTDLKNEMGVAFLPVLTELAGLFSQLAKDIMPVVTPLVQMFAQAISGLLTTLEPILPIISTFIANLSEVANLFMAGDITEGTEKLSSAIGEMGKGLSEHVPDFVIAGIELIDGIVKGMVDAMPQMLDIANDILVQMVQYFVTKAPEMMTTGLTLITNLINGIAQMLPQLIPLAVQMVVNIVMGIVEALPMIIEAGLNLLTGLVEGIISALPILIEALPTIILTFVDTILENLPQIIETGITLIQTLATAILDNLPALLDAAVQILLGFVTAIIENMPMIIETAFTLVAQLVTSILEKLPDVLSAGFDILQELISGIISAIPDLISSWAEVLENIFTGVAQALPDVLKAGIDIITNFVNGIIETKESVYTAIGDMLKEMMEKFTEKFQDFIDIGKEIVNGVREGIENAWAGIVDWFNGLVDGLVSGVKGFLGIRSPSTLFANIGEMIPKGLALGIKQGIPGVSKVISKMVDDFTPQIGIGELAVPRFNYATDNIQPVSEGQIVNYYLNANYKTESELSLIQQVRMLEMLNA